MAQLICEYKQKFKQLMYIQSQHDFYEFPYKTFET